MKKGLSIICLMLLFLSAANAQRYAVIDSKFILDKLPEYKDAQKRLDQFSELWQQELDQRQVAMDKMVKDFEAEQVMLPDNLKKKREDEIFNKEKELRDLKQISTKFYKRDIKPYMKSQLVTWTDLDKFTFEKNAVANAIKEFNKYYEN
jgi:Skp family chaperone for outer membrane proteins